MNINKELLRPAVSVIDELADKETIELFELDDILADISLKLINYRIANKITQKQLAEKLVMSQVMISKLESGEYNPTIELLWKLSKKMGWKLTIDLSENLPEVQQIWDTTGDKFNYTPEEIKTLAEGA